MFVTIRCSCGQTLRAPANAAGRKVQCPACFTTRVIPAGYDDEPDPRNQVGNGGTGAPAIFAVAALVLVAGCLAFGASGIAVYRAFHKSDRDADTLVASNSSSETHSSSTDPIASLGAATVADYYPLKVGTKWHYRVETMGIESNATMQISKIESIDGQAMARLDSLIEDQVIASEHLSANETGVFRHRFNGLPASPPICVLKYPIKDGESWKTDFVVGNEKCRVESQCAKEEVTVPAGKYQTVKVTTKMVNNGQRIMVVYWFAKDIGAVKQVVDAVGAGTVTMELESVELGK
jgi:hypothetical protein